MKIHILLALFLLAIIPCFSQTTNNLQLPTSINEDGTPPDASAVLDLQSATQGMLMPRLTSIQRDAIPSPAAGLFIYNTTDSCFNYYSGQIWLKDCGRNLAADVGPAVGITSGGTSVDFGSDIATDADGNIFVIGSFHGTLVFDTTTLTSEGSSDVFIVKYNKEGNPLWAASGGGTSLDFGNGIAADAAGNVLVTGSFDGSATFGSTTLTGAGSDVFMLKYDANGNLLWAASGGGTSTDVGQDVATDTDGNVLVTGYFQNTATFDTASLTSTGGREVFTVKYDTNGNLLWAASGGGTSHDVGNDIATDTDGNVFVTGSFFGTATFDTSTLIGMGSFEVFTVKYDTDGSLLWTASGGGTSGDDSHGIATDAVGNVFITGSFVGMATFDTVMLTSTGGIEVFMVKYDTAGNLLWATSGGGTTTDVGSSIATDMDGNVHVTGSFQGMATFGATVITSVGGRDVFTVKYDAAGNLLWAASGGGTSDDFGNGIAADVDGNAFVTGYFVGTATFGAITLASAGSAEMYVVQYNASGGQEVPAANLSASQDNDSDPENELITSATLNGSSLEITDAGGITIVDMSNLNPAETDPEVGTNTINYLPKWDGSSLAQSMSVFEDGSGNVGIGTTSPSYQLEVCGTIATTAASVTTSITCSSDRRFKKNISPLANSLEKVLSLRGVNYDWRISEFPEKHFNEGQQIGFIAQEIEEVLPLVVQTDGKGYKSVDYSRLTPVLVEAIKSQQGIIEKQQMDIENLKSQLSEMMQHQQRMAKLETEMEALKELVKREASAPATTAVGTE